MKTLKLAPLFLLLTTAAHADGPAVVTKVPGQPVLFTLDPEHVITYQAMETFAVFKTAVTLSDNTCTRANGTKGVFIEPIIRRAIVPFWAEHPTMKGQPVLRYDSDDKRNEVMSKTAILSLLHQDVFLRVLKIAKPESAAAAVTREKLLGRAKIDHFARIECPGCAGLVPKNKPIVFWDENFEQGNDQVTMSRGENDPSLNAITTRLQNVPVSARGSVLALGVPQRALGLSAGIPAGISYQLQWNFQAPNNIDATDSYCQVKWDMNFTEIFTSFTQADDLTQDPKRLKDATLHPYLYDPADENDYNVSEVFSDTRFNGSDVIK